jgi:nicotinate-nucleotide adenylyltransferase
VLELATVLVAPRPGAGDAATGRARAFDAPLLDISSRELRARRGRGRSLRYLVPDSVWGYIEERGLYRDRPS